MLPTFEKKRQLIPSEYQHLLRGMMTYMQQPTGGYLIEKLRRSVQWLYTTNTLFLDLLTLTCP